MSPGWGTQTDTAFLTLWCCHLFLAGVLVLYSMHLQMLTRGQGQEDKALVSSINHVCLLTCHVRPIFCVLDGIGSA